jgi:hypothetical protein
MQGGFVTIGGVQCDLDAGLHADYGQWPRPAAPSGPAKTWGAWKTEGHTSLADVSKETGMECSSILRRTAIKYGAFDNVIAAYVNGVFAGSTPVTANIPAGGRLWVLR